MSSCGGWSFLSGHLLVFLFAFMSLVSLHAEAAIKKYQFDLFREWWHGDVEEIVKQGNAMGLPPNMSDAHTINGKPGPLFPCSEKRKT
ncbi:hypothetical protein L1887_08274 [Cichorium endivia]|nr:hypothetical protein L1887_08274 [Cichorium endivia]